MAQTISLKRFALGAAAATAIFFPGMASASLSACSNNILGTNSGDPGVYKSTGCQISSATNDSTAGGNANFANFTVNTEGFFGFNDWLFDGKKFDNPAPSLVTFSGDTKSGKWALSPTLPASITDLLFVFKDGANTTLVGYRVAPSPGCTGLAGASPCTYASPFVAPPFNVTTTKDISHISVYFREGSSTQVPEPGALGLLALGLAVLGMVRRKRAA